jgi:hypothetical protein
MTREEDLVRSTTRAIASTVRDVAPLRLEPAPDELRHSLRPGHGAGNRRMRPWFAPLAATVAVAAVAVCLVIVKHIADGPMAPPAAASSASREAPEYYASLNPPSRSASGTRQGLLVGDTFTGKTVATVDPPAGESFISLSAAAADDRAWVAYAMPAGHGHGSAGSWYLLRLAPGTAHPVRLTSLPVKSLAGVVSMALSWSGRELAVAQSMGLPGKRMLEIYSVATGRLLREWTTMDSSVFLDSFTALGLTWIDSDHAIAFPVIVSLPKREILNITLEAVRSVDVAAPGGDLISHSRVIWSTTAARAVGPLSCNGSPYPVVSADGKTMTCVSLTVVSGSSRSKTRLWRLAWLTYPTSAQPGQSARGATIDYQITVATTGQSWADLDPLWANTTGSTLLGEWLVAIRPPNPPREVIHFGVIGHGTFTPLPIPAALLTEPQLSSPM